MNKACAVPLHRKEALMAGESPCCSRVMERPQSQHEIRYFTILPEDFKQAIGFLSFPVGNNIQVTQGSMQH